MKKQEAQDQLNKAGKTVANRLSKWINPLSTSTKKIGFLIVGITIGIASFLMVMQSVKSEQAGKALEIDKITLPEDIHEDEKPSVDVSEQSIINQYNRMIQFKSLIDKFRSSSNKRSLDSLMKVHPGLRDSLNVFIETYY